MFRFKTKLIDAIAYRSFAISYAILSIEKANNSNIQIDIMFAEYLFALNYIKSQS